MCSLLFFPKAKGGNCINKLTELSLHCFEHYHHYLLPTVHFLETVPLIYYYSRVILKMYLEHMFYNENIINNNHNNKDYLSREHIQQISSFANKPKTKLN